MSDKLFNQYKINGVEYNDLYLKNKYLYLTTKGVVNYLRLYEKQKKGINSKYYDFEKKKVRNRINQILGENEGRLSIVSLGAANSNKEIDIFNKIDKNYLKRIDYYPVDISDYLIHLGIIDISSTDKLSQLEVKSIISDFWDLSDYLVKEDKKRSELFGENKKNIFLILGGTFGNYTENDFLNKVINLMGIHDELIISIKLKDPAKKISDEYEHGSDVDFLMEPLTYIPYYYGYSKYHRNLLVKNEDAKLENEDEKLCVSVVPDSVCHAPFINVKHGKMTTDKKIRLAWTTRYNKESLEKWIENYRSGGDNNGDFCFVKSQSEMIESENDYALLFLKKEYYDYTREIVNFIPSEDRPDNYNNFIENMSLKDKRSFFNDYIKGENDTKKAVKQIKKLIK